MIRDELVYLRHVLDAIGRIDQYTVGVDEKTAAHADPPVNAPYRKFQARVLQRFAPGEHVLIDTVDERAIQIEEEGWW